MKGLFIAVLLFVFSCSLFYAQVGNPRSRFVILADRAGGEQSGYFEEIIRQIKTLSPDFVVSVGDVIDGYTKDEDYLEKMWVDFDEKIKNLGVPFYVVAGNHDYSNDLMAKFWHKKWGKSYSAVTINGDVFWFLNTEENYNGKLSTDQLDYFKMSFSECRDDNWLYIFMHRPLWKDAETNGYSELLKIIKNKKKVIVFGGHEHHYAKNIVEGINHYMLATSGGGNELRDNSLGEFHHFLYVTMDEDFPIISNITTNGIVSEDIVSDENEDLVNNMRDISWITILPSFLSEVTQDSVVMNFSIKSGISDSIKLSVNFPKLDSISFETKETEIIIGNGSDNLEYKVYNKGRDLMSVSPLDVVVNLECMKDKHKIKTSSTKKWFLETQYYCSEHENWIECLDPYYVKEDWDWHGPEDGSFRFSLSYDNFDYILKIIYDDNVSISKALPKDIQDKFFIMFGDDAGNKYEYVACRDGLWDSNYNNRNDISWNDGKIVIRIPKSKMLFSDNFFFNIGFMDHDNQLNQKPSVLWWRPLNGIYSFDFPFGKFVIDKIK